MVYCCMGFHQRVLVVDHTYSYHPLLCTEKSKRPESLIPRNGITPSNGTSPRLAILSNNHLTSSQATNNDTYTLKSMQAQRDKSKLQSLMGQ
jgi:hypothetical protein